MGCCIGTTSSPEYSEDFDTENTGKNLPLAHERIKWKAEVCMTEGQLLSKRDEFWDTAPAFDGRQEIWDALKAAASHAEQGDYALAQAIIDGANISLPNGNLLEAYDELGNRYQIPKYCLYHPVNMVDEDSATSCKSNTLPTADSRRSKKRSHRTEQMHSKVEESGSSSKWKLKGRHKTSGILKSDHHRPARFDKNAILGPADCEMPAHGSLVKLKLRLSNTDKDILFDVRSVECIGRLKWRLHYLYPNVVPVPQGQRWFFSGKLLPDKATIDHCHIPDQFVIQVVINVNYCKTLPIVADFSQDSCDISKNLTAISCYKTLIMREKTDAEVEISRDFLSMNAAQKKVNYFPELRRHKSSQSGVVAAEGVLWRKHSLPSEIEMPLNEGRERHKSCSPTPID